MVLLHHDLPDSSWHLDWMLEQPGTDSRRLITFRVDQRIDDPACEMFHAEHLADHRAIYLEYEGDISRNRGCVRRLARGECEILDMTDRSLIARITWDSSPRMARGTLAEGARWSFTLGPDESTGTTPR